MRKTFLMLFVLAMLLAVAVGTATAVETPVSLSHTLVGYTVGADSVTLDFVLHVENSGTTLLSNLTLEHVPLMLLTQEETFLNIGTIDTGAAMDVPFTVTVPALLSQEEVAAYSLYWAGEGNDSSGTFLEFPAESHLYNTGGAQ